MFVNKLRNDSAKLKKDIEELLDKLLMEFTNKLEEKKLEIKLNQLITTKQKINCKFTIRLFYDFKDKNIELIYLDSTDNRVSPYLVVCSFKNLNNYLSDSEICNKTCSKLLNKISGAFSFLGLFTSLIRKIDLDSKIFYDIAVYWEE